MADFVQDDVVSVQRGSRRFEKDVVRSIEFHPQTAQLVVRAAHSFDFLDKQKAASVRRYSSAEFLQIEGGRNLDP
ncbi:hypothetical protein ACFYRD_05250 [Streptomyces hirsutus]|uniref:hypothetical protein n=1 Tax=Streptomyces hirsutus TaxID=35620 RepID=UPI0036C9F846